MNSVRRLAIGVVACLASAGLAAAVAPSSAQAASAPERHRTYLVLTIGYGENTDNVDRSATLRCEPSGGSHPQAVQACQELQAVDGQIAAIPERDGFCTKEYNPVTVTAAGWWRGERIRYRETYSNPCVMRLHTGTLFQF